MIEKFPPYRTDKHTVMPFAFDQIYIHGPELVDESGHKIVVRGANLNVLHPSEKTLPIKIAKERFIRFKKEGVTAVRLRFTWKSIEPRRAGEYDQDQLNYIKNLMRTAYETGLYSFIDMHIDHWKGAPDWTKEVVGFDPLVISDKIKHKHDRFICDTMNTLFFGSKKFAPKFKIEEIPAEEYLQRAYCKMLVEVAKRARTVDNVLAINILDKPSLGYIGMRNLKNSISWKNIKQAEGFESDTRAWQIGEGCLWKNSGMWKIKERGDPIMVEKRYFRARNGYAHAALNQFVERAAKAIHSVSPTTFFTVGQLNYQKPVKIPKKRLRRYIRVVHYIPRKFSSLWSRIRGKSPKILLEAAPLLSQKLIKHFKKAEQNLEHIFYPSIPDGEKRLQLKRPYPQIIIGKKNKMKFNPKTKLFQYTFRGRIKHSYPAVIFLPEHHYKNGFSVKHTGGRLEFIPEESHLLFYPDEGRRHKMTILPVLQVDPMDRELSA